MLQLHDTVCKSYGPRFLHWGFSILSFFGAIFVWKVLPETSGKTLEQIETFFVHLRREAMDLIGDSAACREPKKGPLFRFVTLEELAKSKQDVEKTEKISDRSPQCELNPKAIEQMQHLPTLPTIEEEPDSPYNNKKPLPGYFNERKR